MTRGRSLALAAALLMGAPAMAAPGGVSVIWVELCDGVHPGRRIPLPLDPNDGNRPGQACHAGCGAVPDRRARR